MVTETNTDVTSNYACPPRFGADVTINNENATKDRE